MVKNDKCNHLKELLKTGERDKVILAKKIGYTGANNKRLRDSLNRLINKHPDLKQLYENSVIKKPVEATMTNNDKNTPVGKMKSIESFEDLVSISNTDPVIKILTNEIIKIKKDISKRKNDTTNFEEVFILKDKYNHVSGDEVVPVSLRMTREARRLLDNFSKENSGHKKVYIVSQMIENFVEKYK